MSVYVKNRRKAAGKKIKGWDWILLIGLSLTPMTSLRIWKIGPAELLCFICGLRFLNRSKIKNSPLLKFFFYFLLIMLLGTFIGRIITPRETELLGILTWVYFAFISVTIYSGLSKNSLQYNEKLLRTFTCMTCLLYSTLCLYAVYVGRTFWGMPLWYGGVRFTGGANNPHQLSILISIILVLFLRDIIKNKRYVINIIGIMSCEFILNKTISTTAIAASTVGAVAMIFLYISNMFSHLKIPIYIIISTFLILFFILFYKEIWQYFLVWLSEDENGMGRLELLKDLPRTFIKSPLFGLGPGSHAYGVMEYHNTYSEVLAATGLVGFIVFIVFSVYLLKLCKYDYTCAPVFVALYVYGLGGFGMRQLIFWGSTVFMICILEQSRAQQNKFSAEKRQYNEP